MLIRFTRLRPLLRHSQPTYSRSELNPHAVSSRSSFSPWCFQPALCSTRRRPRRNLIGTPFVPTPTAGHGKRRGHRQGEAQRSSPPSGLTARAAPRGIWRSYDSHICLHGSIACVGTSRPDLCFVPMHGSVPKRDPYRAHALECLEEARAVKKRELSNVFHRLAMWWVILAHQTEDDDSGPHISGRFGSMTSDGDTETSPGTPLTFEGAHLFFRSPDPARLKPNGNCPGAARYVDQPSGR
jgi:hypothetical protein